MVVLNEPGTDCKSLCTAPAQEALRYQREIFPDAFHERTHFMGDPSPQLDSYWQETYDVPTRIPKWQADLLETPTIELPGDKGYYVILLDIFHSMHCLNEIRKSLHPEYYLPYHLRMNTTEEKAIMHLGEPVFLSLYHSASYFLLFVSSCYSSLSVSLSSVKYFLYPGTSVVIQLADQAAWWTRPLR